MYASYKRVNKSLQDRLRRDRISRSMDQLKWLILGPSMEHAKIGKADILKLTVQYIRNLRQKELIDTSPETQTSLENCNGEPDINRTRNNATSKQSAWSTELEGRIQPAETDAPETEAGSENSKPFFDKNVNSGKTPFSIQSQKCRAKSVVFRNALSVSRPRSSTQKRAPLKQLNCNSCKQLKSKQTIWRPW